MALSQCKVSRSGAMQPVRRLKCRCRCIAAAIAARLGSWPDTSSPGRTCFSSSWRAVSSGVGRPATWARAASACKMHRSKLARTRTSSSRIRNALSAPRQTSTMRTNSRTCGGHGSDEIPACALACHEDCEPSCASAGASGSAAAAMRHDRREKGSSSKARGRPFSGWRGRLQSSFPICLASYVASHLPLHCITASAISPRLVEGLEKPPSHFTRSSWKKLASWQSERSTERPCWWTCRRTFL
mmetsp:Transcript_53387/g.155633  ORF Transcript_53387/g.155633 Transcript_53387/m.155633 type:complete len:243 (+) Transcript_53387:1051-1779(+)